MNSKSERKKNIYLSIGLILFALCVTGATYAYFALSASNNSLTGTVGGATLTLTVNKIVPTTQTTNMIPQLESTLGDAISDSYNCVDDNNNVICHVYKATITNGNQATSNLKGIISFDYTTNSDYEVEDKLPNLKWKRIADATTIGEYDTYQALSTDQTFEEGKVFNPGASQEYYFVVWVDEIGEEQNDNGTFRVNINFKSGDGDGLTSTVRPNTLLSTVEVGSYVAYTGVGGIVGDINVSCKLNGEGSSEVDADETEAPNSCLGQNAREDLEIDSSTSRTCGYCRFSDYKFTTTGWRVAYIDKTDPDNSKAVLISAGSPECNTRAHVLGNATYIKQANAYALKYCNSEFVDNGCTCEVAEDETVTGGCTTPSTDAWAIGDTDYQKITGSTLIECNMTSTEACGLNNTLISNGGLYWYAAKYDDSVEYGVHWRSDNLGVHFNSITYAYGLRPLISLSSSVYITGGTGTMSDPYQIANE